MVENKNYLDKSGLTTLWERVKMYVDNVSSDTKLTSATISIGIATTPTSDTVDVVSNTEVTMSGSTGTSVSGSFTSVKVPTKAYVDNKLDGKVDVVSGMGLSTNDYTTAEKTKLDGIAVGAEVNVQSDWNATTGDALILNKPVNVSQFNNDAEYATETYVDGKINALVNGAPESLNTLDELAAALKDNKDIVDVLNSSIGGKADKAHTHNYTELTGSPSISASVSDTIGTPSVNVGVAGSNWTFTFNNLKGVTGPQGDQGPIGPQGATGPKGADLTITYSTATISSVPATYAVVKCTISTNASFAMSATPTAGKNVHILIYNSSSSDRTVSIPTASPYVNLGEASLTVPTEGWAEINVISDGTNRIIRSA